MPSPHNAEFGEALGLGETPRTTTETTALSAAINDVAFAIAEYGRLMVGELDRNDPVNVERFKKALAPLDAYRASNTSRRGGGEEEDIVDIDEPVEPEADVDPNGPIPPIPGDPAQV